MIILRAQPKIGLRISLRLFDHFVDIRILSHFYYTLANYLAFYELAI